MGPRSSVIQIIFVIISCTQLTFGGSVTHDLFLGDQSNGSVSLLQQVVRKINPLWGSRIFRRNIDLTMRFPPNGDFDRPIRRIMINDLSKNGEGGYPTVSEGGVGYRHVKVYFKSARGGDIEFNVSIYGDGGSQMQSINQPHSPGWVNQVNQPNYPSNIQANYPNPNPPYPPPYGFNNRF